MNRIVYSRISMVVAVLIAGVLFPYIFSGCGDAVSLTSATSTSTSTTTSTGTSTGTGETGTSTTGTGKG